MTAGNLTLFSAINYSTCDAVTLAYGLSHDYHSSFLNKAVKWIPAMISYAICTLNTLITLTIDVALTIITGLLSLITFRQVECLNKYSFICLRSIYYDLQALSITLIGTAVPELALHLRREYYRINQSFV